MKFSRQNVLAFSFMLAIAGALLMIGADGASAWFWIGLGLFSTSFIGWIVALMWKVAGGIDDIIGKHV